MPASATGSASSAACPVSLKPWLDLCPPSSAQCCTAHPATQNQASGCSLGRRCMLPSPPAVHDMLPPLEAWVLTLNPDHHAGHVGPQPESAPGRPAASQQLPTASDPQPAEAALAPQPAAAVAGAQAEAGGSPALPEHAACQPHFKQAASGSHGEKAACQSQPGSGAPQAGSVQAGSDTRLHRASGAALAPAEGSGSGQEGGSTGSDKAQVPGPLACCCCAVCVCVGKVEVEVVGGGGGVVLVQTRASGQLMKSQSRPRHQAECLDQGGGRVVGAASDGARHKKGYMSPLDSSSCA